MHAPSFIQDLALVLGVAALTGLAFRLLRQPSILGYLFAGLIVGPYIPIPLFANPDRVHALSELGVVLVMFAVGLEFRIEKFLRVLPISGVTGLIEIAALFAAGYLCGRYLGWTQIGSLFLGGCICISSTMAVSKIFEQRPVADDARQFVYGVLVLQDVAAIALIAVMTAISKGVDASFIDVLGILGRLVGVLLAIIAGGMFVVPRMVRLLVKTESRETLVVGAIGLCFSFAVLAEYLGYSAALGAFLAGILVAESGSGHKVENATSAVRDMFTSVFFVSIGMSVDPRLAIQHFPTALLLLGVVIVAQFLSVALGGLLSGSGLRRSVTAGIALGQIGEFSFIISAIGAGAYVVRRELQPILVTVAVLSTFTTAVLLRGSDQIINAVDRALPARLRRLLAIYESWFDAMRTHEPQGKGAARVIRGVVFDLLLMAGMVLAFRSWDQELEIFLTLKFQLSRRMSHLVASALLGLALVPILIPLSLSARKIAGTLTARVFLDEQSNARSLLQASLTLLVVATVGIPLTLVFATVVGVHYVWPAFILILGVSGLFVWRRARMVDEEILSGGVMMLRAIADQGMPEAERASHPPLPGLTDLREVTLQTGSFAVGKTLAELKVRSLTGASVVALRGPRHSVHLPSGNETLDVGYTLFIAGARIDQDAAEELLRSGATRESLA